MNTPIAYYGGKQKLISEIIPLIPHHDQYVEPFCGGASLFWAKIPSNHEVLNDFDMRVLNFWYILQNDFQGLYKRIKETLHHEQLHIDAKKILKAGMVDRTEFAWAFWVQTQMSFSNKLLAGFAFDNDGRTTQGIYNKINGFKESFHLRIKDTELFCRDAIEIIKLKDDEGVFMYLDPPYAESNCGHYEKGKNIYYTLLDILPSLKCKWLMSSYPSEQLNTLRKGMGLNFKDAKMNLSVSGKHNGNKFKTECLTWNYEQKSMQHQLFDDPDLYFTPE